MVYEIRGGRSIPKAMNTTYKHNKDKIGKESCERVKMVLESTDREEA